MCDHIIERITDDFTAKCVMCGHKITFQIELLRDPEQSFDYELVTITMPGVTKQIVWNRFYRLLTPKERVAYRPNLKRLEWALIGLRASHWGDLIAGDGV